MIYLKLFLVAMVTIYVVDVSGFTASWRSLLARALKVSALRPLPPFDCGKCMTLWVCLIYAICAGQFTLWTVAFTAMLSLLSIPLGQLMIFIREWVTWLIDTLMP